MDKCKSQLMDFIEERINEGRRQLYGDEEYMELFRKRQEAERNLYVEDREIRTKFNDWENLGTQLEILQDANTYLQGVRDAKIINEMLGQ